MNTSKKIMFILGIVLIIGFILMMVIESRTASKLEFEPMEGQIALLHKAYDKWFGEPMDMASSTQGQYVLCDWLKYRGSVATGSVDLPDWAERFNADEMDLVVAHSIRADYWVSRAAFDEWVAIFNGDSAKHDAVVARCVNDIPDIREAIDADMQAFRAFAANEDLLDANGKLRSDKLDIIELIYRHLWILLSSEQLPRISIEPPEEKIAFLRWQVEVSNMPIEKKILKLEQFGKEKNDAYDFMFALAVLYAQNGMLGEACVILREALSEADNAANGAFRKRRYSDALKNLEQAHPAACRL